ncbi:Elongation factor 1-gamma [Oopsacas minuta]|uniref:Elongation factor 1-gamma n=1 Tax=Oopsacas minuta TaxID=111878 RepID=A0AAV7JD04_9METZ|nr:Elongation factor 1-gamma [Oopsacas minuta]
MQGTLYAARDDVRTFKVQIAANYSGKAITVLSDPPQFILGETNVGVEFLSKFPLGKVPAFETTNGDTLVHSDAIASYLSNAELRGATEFDQAKVQQFVSIAESEVMPACCNWVYPTLGIIQPNKLNVDKAKQTITDVLCFLNQHLSTRTFLVGERVSLADISMTCSFLLLYKQVLEPSLRDSFENTNRWFITCINQPHFKAVIGEVALCEKMAQFDSKRYNELNKKEGGGKKAKVPAATKAESKKEAPAKEAKEEIPALDDDEDDDILIRRAEPKSVDPYKDLPPASLNMDEFKGVYSNKDIETVALPFFFENIKLEEHSIWHCVYEYVDELNQPFMACNLVSGFYQRIDKLRKTAFGVMAVFTQGVKAIGIEGIWVFRGQEKAFDLCEDWNIDAPSYTFRKLNLEQQDDKQKVCDFFLRKDNIGGVVVHDAKVFK